MMKILALDCSTQACSVALLQEQAAGQVEVIEQYELAARSHTERLLPMVDQLLATAQYSLTQLDAIAFGCGPGSFTGLRICLSAVQGLAFGAERPVVPVSSLAGLAQTAQATMKPASNTTILSTIDARMDEIYCGFYRVIDELVVLEGDERLCAPENLVLPPGVASTNVIAVGTGLDYLKRIVCADQLTHIDPQLLPRASGIARLASKEINDKGVKPPEQALPTYLREQVAWQKTQ